MVKVKEDLTGKKFGRLTVLYQTDDYISRKKGGHYARWHCVCDCDKHNEIDTLSALLKQGKTKSCGCFRAELTKNVSKKYNDYYIDNNIVYIKLSNCDEYTMVDLECWDKIPYIRYVCWYKGYKNYVESNIPKELVNFFW